MSFKIWSCCHDKSLFNFQQLYRVLFSWLLWLKIDTELLTIFSIQNIKQRLLKIKWRQFIWSSNMSPVIPVLIIIPQYQFQWLSSSSQYIMVCQIMTKNCAILWHIGKRPSTNFVNLIYLLCVVCCVCSETGETLHLMVISNYFSCHKVYLEKLTVC